jgi:hypothetical protein
MLAFIAIVIMPATTKAADPTAVAMTTNVTTAGGTLYSFTVLYRDDGEINVGTLDNNDLRVTGPGGFDVAATFVSADVNRSNSQAIAKYSIVPPGGSWDSADNGTYTVVMQPNQVTDGLGNPVAAGNISSFSVMVPPSSPTPTPGTLGNISTRLRVETGDNALIGGFIITGTQQKKVILRAIGPSLSFPDKLADPILELHDSSGALLETNDNWVDSPNKQAIIDTGIPPSNNLESAIVRTLPANNAAYTAIVRGVNNGTGIGVVEAYDLDRTVDSKLANISTRGFVQTGDNVLIAGTIVLGQTPQKVIIRAIGPSLPISGALANPTLELHDGNGAVLDSNDNWKDSPNKQAIIDSTIPPTNDLESAIVATLPANGAQYTAIVRGVNSGTGIGVVEVYALN